MAVCGQCDDMIPLPQVGPFHGLADEIGMRRDHTFQPTDLVAQPGDRRLNSQRVVALPRAFDEVEPAQGTQGDIEGQRDRVTEPPVEPARQGTAGDIAGRRP